MPIWERQALAAQGTSLPLRGPSPKRRGTRGDTSRFDFQGARITGPSPPGYKIHTSFSDTIAIENRLIHFPQTIVSIHDSVIPAKAGTRLT